MRNFLPNFLKKINSKFTRSRESTVFPWGYKACKRSKKGRNFKPHFFLMQSLASICPETPFLGFFYVTSHKCENLEK
jgi:hypothetical protein